MRYLTVPALALSFLISLLGFGSNNQEEAGCRRPGLPVLLYHAIDGTGNQKGHYGLISKNLFIEQLDYLKQEGYQTIPLDDLYNYVTSGVIVPEKSVVLTFDDTNDSDYSIAFPELKKRGFSGVFFAIGNRAIDEVWVNRLREMRAGGMEIASHTMNHLYLAGGPETAGRRIQVASDNVVRFELAQSKKTLEEIIGSEVGYLAWPGDSFTSEMVKIARAVGYQGIFMAKTEYTENIMKHPFPPRQNQGFNTCGDNPLYLKRITINGKYPLASFIKVLENGVYPPV